MKKVFSYILLILFSIAFFYLVMPTLNFGYYGVLVYFFLLLGYAYFSENVRKSLKKNTGEPYKASVKVIAGFWLYLVIVVLMIIFSTAAIFYSSSYQKMLGDVNTGEELSAHLAPISLEQVAIVDRQIAYRLGDKVIGSVPSLGSQTELGNFTLQKVNDQLCWVAPLLHSGYFPWSENSAGTPGYIKVSATNDRDVELVQSYDGVDIQIKYQPNAYFSDNLSRHIYFNGYMTQGFTDFTFELDDRGKPYWVITLYAKKVGFSGANATGVITVDPKSGEIKEYGIGEAPKWIDRIQPAGFVVDQLNAWGEYVNGYWNPSNQDKLKTTEGVTIVFGQDGQAYWYTGLTSVGKDEGTVGFALVNTRTKETIWYKQVGATEEAAQLSAMGKVQEKGYGASFPVTYNINGVPTYIMSLKDQAGLIKMLAMVSVEDYTIVGVGNTLREALRSYKNSLNSVGGSIDVSSESDLQAIRDIISRINADNRDGNTFYYFTTESQPGVFVGTSLLSTDLVLTQAGDSVVFRVEDTDLKVIDIVDFDNLNIQEE